MSKSAKAVFLNYASPDAEAAETICGETRGFLELVRDRLRRGAFDLFCGPLDAFAIRAVETRKIKLRIGLFSPGSYAALSGNKTGNKGPRFLPVADGSPL